MQGNIPTKYGQSCMVKYLHFRILKFALTLWYHIAWTHSHHVMFFIFLNIPNLFPLLTPLFPLAATRQQCLVSVQTSFNPMLELLSTHSRSPGVQDGAMTGDDGDDDLPQWGCRQPEKSMAFYLE